MTQKPRQTGFTPLLIGPLSAFLSGVFLGEWNVLRDCEGEINFRFLGPGRYFHLAWSALAGHWTGRRSGLGYLAQTQEKTRKNKFLSLVYCLQLFCCLGPWTGIY